MKFFSSALILLSAVALCAAPVCNRQTVRKITVNGDKSGKSDITGKMHNLEEKIKDVERKLSKTDTDSKKHMSLEHERSRLALEFVHEAQKYIFDGKLKRNDNRSRKIILMLDNESAMLKKTLADVKTFPYVKYLDNVQAMLKDIRSGKLKYSKKIPARDSALLNEIQQMQRDALEEFHKQQMRSRSR